MKLNRSAFTTHIKKIHCGGLIPGAVFREAFACRALSEDQLLMIDAPSLPKSEKLKDAIGIANLDLLARAAAHLPGEGNAGATLNLTVADHRLLVNEGERGELSLMTASPRTIGSKVEDHTVDAMLGKLDKDNQEGIPLTRVLVEGITSTFSLLKAEEIELVVGPDGGEVVVGNENSHMGHFEFDYKTEEEYALLFGKHIVSVLGQIDNFADARLYLTTPDGFIGITDGPYTYILSSKARGAD